MYAMQRGDVEPTRVVQNALDVLAQMLVAMVAADRRPWTTHGTARLRAASVSVPPTDARNAFDETLAMLAGKYPSDSPPNSSRASSGIASPTS